jgi:dTDP-4-amino-4,6-dideoxygalactose transaminase
MRSDGYIPFHVPDIGEEEIAEVVETLRSGWLTTGSRTARFEDDFKTYCGARYALAVNSGTAALHLALAGLDIGSGDEVITTPLTFCATVNAILHVGATPVLADIKADGNIDPSSIARRLSPATKAIIPVHLAGAPCDMDAIWRIASERNLHVIEDAAHAAGARYRGAHLGSALSASAAAAFSFYATKNITTAEGGMVVTNNKRLAERMRRLALHGMTRDAWNRYSEGGGWEYRVVEPGFKYNLSDVHAAIGIHQLRKAEKFTEARATIARLYNQAFADVPELQCPSEPRDGRSAWHLYVVRLKLKRLRVDRAEFIRELARRKIGVSVHFIPIPLHPFFEPWARDPRNRCPRATAFYRSIISLPIYPSMTEEDVNTVASAVRDIVARNRNAAAVEAAAAY